ncbi:MAG: hypothetical protein Q4P13_12370, partial [Psychrobacter sp.]|nr:hypothetical protein [Psychrobacter sp.]
NAKGQKHAEVLAKIKSFNSWLKLSESSYAVSTSLTASQIFEHFESLIDSNDRMYVIPLMQQHQSWATQEEHDWLNNNLTYS